MNELNRSDPVLPSQILQSNTFEVTKDKDEDEDLFDVQSVLLSQVPKVANKKQVAPIP